MDPFVPKAPEVSVVVTNYNKGRALSRAINSIAAQRTQPGETVLVDDMSVDPDSIEILERLSEFPNKVKLIRHERRQGASAAKNSGIRASRGSIVMLLDGDDELPENAVADVAAFFRANEEIDFVYGDVERITKGIRVVSRGSNFSHSDGELDARKLALNWALHGTTPFTRKCFDEVGGFDQSHPRTDDIDFFRKAIWMGMRGKYIPRTIYITHLDDSENSRGINSLTLSFSWFRSIDFYFSSLPLSRFIGMFISKCLLLGARLLRSTIGSNRPAN